MKLRNNFETRRQTIGQAVCCRKNTCRLFILHKDNPLVYNHIIIAK